ncbi:MAG: hypothetical protein K1060chlam4_00262 [Candidatus Anoxychlamydiales bacterium]|nr:hypothetical protein [Candidatus Anoxychlamydiales bacterium]
MSNQNNLIELEEEDKISLIFREDSNIKRKKSETPSIQGENFLLCITKDPLKLMDKKYLDPHWSQS